MIPPAPPSPGRLVDRTLRQVALAAVAIVLAALAALAAMLLSWHAVAGGETARGTAAAQVALASEGPALVVDSLGREGPAERAGLRVGDVLESVNGERLARVAAADRALAAPAVDIRVRRGDKTLLIHLPPDRSETLGQPNPADRGR